METSLVSKIDLGTYYDSYLDCKKHKATTKSSEEYELNALFNLEKQRQEIENRTLVPSPLIVFIIKDPSIREIWCSDFSDRVNHHFMMNEMSKCIEDYVSENCYNCRIGRGTDKAISKLVSLYKIQSGNYTRKLYCLKGDFSGFFMSIRKDILISDIYALIDRKYRGKYSEELKYLFRKYLIRDVTEGCRIIDSPLRDRLPANKTLFNNNSSTGLEIGTLIAQTLCNVYLKPFDEEIKDRGFRAVRYVDDWIVLSEKKADLENLLNVLEIKLKDRNITINKKKTKIRNCAYGIPFLNKVLFPYNIVLNQSLIDRIYRDTRGLMSINDLENAYIGRKGLALRYGAYNILWKFILAKMKDCNSYNQDTVP